MVECGGVVMYAVPIVRHCIAGDVLNVLWVIVIPHVSEGNKFVVLLCTCDTTLVDYSAPLCCPDVFCFYASGAFRAGATVRAVINTVHIELEHNITWSLCFWVYRNFVGSEMKLVLLQPILLV